MEYSEDTIKIEAENFARLNKKKIAKDIILKYDSEIEPISIFMAGSPGAGKTEASIRLIESLTNKQEFILRIDPDELRSFFDKYNGSNSHLFQNATTFISEKIHDLAIDKSLSFIFDTTFSKIEKARDNIKRSLSHERGVEIIYVYQDPVQAWKFVQNRETVEGRHIPKESFIEKYFNARVVVNQIKKEFPLVKIHLIYKNIDGTNQEYWENIDNIDFYVKEKYTFDMLKEMLQ